MLGANSMTKLYLITGFLGAGKTTFLKEFAKLFAGQRIAVLVNEFGKEDVDGQLLKDLQARLASIYNGSIFCACRLEQFEQVLSEMADEKPDIILVETSGLSDPTSIQRILSNGEKYAGIRYMGCICLADAVHFEKVYATAAACRKQLETANAVVLNKIDLVANIAGVRCFIHRQNPAVIILETAFGIIPPDWTDVFECLPAVSGTGTLQIKDLSIQSYVISVDETIPVERLIDFLNMFAAETYRIKGFVSLNGSGYFADCVGSDIKVTARENGGNSNRLVVLAGHGMRTLPAMKQAAENAQPFHIRIE